LIKQIVLLENITILYQKLASLAHLLVVSVLILLQNALGASIIKYMLSRPILASLKLIRVLPVSKILFFQFAESVVSSVRHALTISHVLLVFQITVSLISSVILQEIALKAILITGTVAHNAHQTVLLVFHQPFAITALQDFI
jgi:hypothetical protein